jgi:hypothetical protein
MDASDTSTPGGSTTSSSTHKRTKSAPRIPSGPNPASLFLTNLRLLNLDTLADWPSITPSTFSNVDARARIKAAEWSLYQLFRISDPATTAEKLQPFFPPLEPLQSINLRAALYRCLDGLKKNGILGRDVVLRKTMLDECAGDKFWEVCVAFSAIVVRKKVVGKRGRDGLGRPVAQTLGTAQSLGKVDKDIMMPLMVAHRVSLARNLSEKKMLAEQFAQLGDILREKEDDMSRRKAEISQDGKIEQVQRQLEHFEPLEDVLRRGWVGDEGFEEALLSGGSAASSDRVLNQSTEALFDRRSSRVSNNAQADRDLVSDIASKARGQNLRLKRWEALYNRLQAAKPKPTLAEQAKNRGDASQVRFDRHADLTVADTKPQRGFGSPTKNSPTKAHHSRGASACVAGYDNILTALREELRLARQNPHSVTKDARHSRSTSDAVSGASRSSAFQPLQARQHSRSPSLQHSPSQSPVPFRPGMGRRISSRSRSYQQPKVISQRGPIPLKTELFSPLKSARPGSHSPRSASISRPTSLLPTPQEEMDESMASIDHTPNRQDRSDSIPYSNSHRPNHMHPSPQEEEDDSVASIDGALAGLGLSHRDANSDLEGSASNFAMPTVSASPIDLDPSKQDRWEDEPEFTMPPPTPASHTPRPSLAERTRLSMAFKSSGNSGILTSGSQTPEEPSSPSLNTANFPQSPSNNNNTPTPPQPTQTLAERTRQSISSSSQPTTPNPRQKHTRSRTSVHQHPDANTTKTPRRSSLNNLTPSQEADNEDESFSPRTHQRIITPRDQLFEASAEYDSVFKSRPRVAHTPPLSPSVLEHDEDEDAEFSMVGALKELDDEGGLGSSPLRR